MYAIPWIKETYPKGNFAFQQDDAPAHSEVELAESWAGSTSVLAEKGAIVRVPRPHSARLRRVLQCEV